MVWQWKWACSLVNSHLGDAKFRQQSTESKNYMMSKYPKAYTSIFSCVRLD